MATHYMESYCCKHWITSVDGKKIINWLNAVAVLSCGHISKSYSLCIFLMRLPLLHLFLLYSILLAVSEIIIVLISLPLIKEMSRMVVKLHACPKLIFIDLLTVTFKMLISECSFFKHLILQQEEYNPMHGPGIYQNH